MALVRLSCGTRMLDQHFRALQEIIFYGHGADGHHLPQALAIVIYQQVLPFLAVPKIPSMRVAAGGGFPVQGASPVHSTDLA